MAGQTSNEHRTKLVSRALSRLVELIVASTGVSNDTVRAAYDWSESIILRHRLSFTDGDDVEIRNPRIKQSADLIKKKLIREYTSPEKALRFTNLYSRLLTQNVLHQKWTMLFFLYQLSETPPLEVLQSSSHLGQISLPSSPITPSLVSSKNQREASFSRDSRESRFHTAPQNTSTSSLSSRRYPQQHDDKPVLSSTARQATPHSETKTERPREEIVLVSEWDLLRELPFALQGISTSNLKFNTSPPALHLPASASVPMVGLLHTLAEPALLYSQLSAFVGSSDGGLVEQSFRSAIEAELTAYLRLVISLENHIRPVLAASKNPDSNNLTKADATLKYCALYLRQPTMGLRLMSVMVEESKSRRGGQLISMVYSFATSHGDPFVSSFAQRLLGDVTKPFYSMLQQWTYHGELSDPYHEFFVREQHDGASTDPINDGRKLGATSVWEEKYMLDEQMVPTIISFSFAKKVFLIGKSLNFIRHGCEDARWVESYAKTYSRELSFGDTGALESSIGEAYKTTMARLMHLMMNKFDLLTHLQALKKYILLGSGDFIAVLMESLASNLDRPANSQYRHTLTAQLEHAVRNSNAQYEPDEVLRRLDSRMLELSHGEIGWDVFTLEYKIEAPVDVVVTPFGAKQYLKVFNFLWRVKRVEFSLSRLWRRCMTGARGVLASVSADRQFAHDWKCARGVLAEMIHFVNQLQYYILFEVIEASWADLVEAINRPECTLDDLIQAHGRYLTSITRKGLLGNATVDFTAQLHGLLKIMLLYRDAVEGLYSFTVTDFTRRQERQAQAGELGLLHDWPVSDQGRYRDRPTSRSRAARKPLLPEDDDVDMDASATSDRRPEWNTATTVTTSAGGAPIASAGGIFGGGVGACRPGETGVLSALRTRLQSLGSDYRLRLSTLLADLMHQPDPDMRWLAMVMNFNDVYQPAVALVRRKRKLQQQQQQQQHQQTQAQTSTHSRSAQYGQGQGPMQMHLQNQTASQGRTRSESRSSHHSHAQVPTPAVGLTSANSATTSGMPTSGSGGNGSGPVGGIPASSSSLGGISQPQQQTRSRKRAAPTSTITLGGASTTHSGSTDGTNANVATAAGSTSGSAPTGTASNGGFGNAMTAGVASDEVPSRTGSSASVNSRRSRTTKPTPGRTG